MSFDYTTTILRFIVFLWKWPIEPSVIFIGRLSKHVFEGRTSTGSEPFSLFICLDANKFVLLSFFSLIKRIYPRVSNKPLPNDAKGPLPVDVRRSTTLLLKLPITKLRETARSRVTHDSDGSRPWQKKGGKGRSPNNCLRSSVWSKNRGRSPRAVTFLFHSLLQR